MRLAALLLVVCCLSFCGCASGMKGFTRNQQPAESTFAQDQTAEEVLASYRESAQATPASERSVYRPASWLKRSANCTANT